MPDNPNTPNPAPSPTPASVDQPWHASLQPEIRGYFERRQMLDKPQLEVLSMTAQAHMNAEQKLGIPSDKIVRLPDPNNAQENAAFWQRFGVPKEAKEYDFNNIKFSDGSAIEDTVAAQIKDLLFKTGTVSAAAGRAITEGIVKMLDGFEASDSTATQAALQQEHEALNREWGANKDSNLFVARQAAMKLGWDKDMIDALEKGIGYQNVMKGLLKAGQALGEDRYVSNNNPGGQKTIMTAEGARARIEELKNDRDWVKRWSSGGSAEMKELNALQTVIAASLAPSQYGH